MEMHPLASAPHSLKELAIHIGIVTVGILIALSLEGIRESIHDHHLVRDARETFRLEIEPDVRHMDTELVGVEETNRATQKIIIDLPTLQKDPAQLKHRVDNLFTHGMGIMSSSWQGALSSGALSLMGADEVRRYADFDYSVRIYTSLEEQALTRQYDLHSYVDSRHSFGPQEMEEVEEKLRGYEMLTQSMGFVGKQVRDDMKEALPQQ